MAVAGTPTFFFSTFPDFDGLRWYPSALSLRVIRHKTREFSELVRIGVRPTFGMVQLSLSLTPAHAHEHISSYSIGENDLEPTSTPNLMFMKTMPKWLTAQLQSVAMNERLGGSLDKTR
jgi:hypothetical protein